MVTGTNGPHDKRLAKQSEDIEKEIKPEPEPEYETDEGMSDDEINESLEEE